MSLDLVNMDMKYITRIAGIHLLVLITLQIRFASTLDCQPDEHNLNGLRCCLKCGPGQGVVTPCNQDNDTVCQVCRKGEMFSPGASHEEPCKLCEICPQYSHVKKHCNSTHDTICECDRNYYLDAVSDSCHQCDLCPMGFGAKRRCDAHRNSVCAQCPQGTYSDVISAEACKVCTSCNENQLMLRYCDSMHDTLCVDMPSAPMETPEPPTTVLTVVVQENKNTQDKLIPVYCAVLGLVIVLLIIYVIVKQVQYRRNPPGSKKNVSYSAVNDPLTPQGGATTTLQTSGVPISRGSDSGVSLEHDNRTVTNSTRIKDLPKVKLQAVEKMLHSCLEYKGGWTSFARELGYNNSKIACFETKSSQTGRMPAEILLGEWSKSENATVEILVKALRSLGREDIINTIYSDSRNIGNIYTPPPGNNCPPPHMDSRNNIPMYNNMNSMHNISQAPTHIQGHPGQMNVGPGHITSSISGSSTTDVSSRYGRPILPTYHPPPGQQMV